MFGTFINGFVYNQAKNYEILRLDTCPKAAERFNKLMHELSIAQNLVEVASKAVQDVQMERVESLHLKLGALSGVVKDALQFSYDIVTEGTVLAGSRLNIEEVPVVIFCETCQAEQTLPDIQWFACPVCAAPSAKIVQGREIEIVSVEIIDEVSYS